MLTENGRGELRYLLMSPKSFYDLVQKILILYASLHSAKNLMTPEVFTLTPKPRSVVARMKYGVSDGSNLFSTLSVIFRLITVGRQ